MSWIICKNIISIKLLEVNKTGSSWFWPVGRCLQTRYKVPSKLDKRRGWSSRLGPAADADQDAAHAGLGTEGSAHGEVACSPQFGAVSTRHSPRAPGGCRPPAPLTGRPCMRAGTSTRSRRGRRAAARPGPDRSWLPSRRRSILWVGTGL